MKFRFFLAVLLIASISLVAENENVGTSGFNFFKLKYSARATAMAGSYMGLSNTADALFFNPAGMQQIEKREVSTTFLNYFEGFSGGSVAYVHPRSTKMKLGVFCSFLGNNDIIKTTANPDGTFNTNTSSFGASDFLIGVGISRYVNEILDLGINVKYLREDLDDASASALAADVAILHQTTNPKLKLGAAIRNIGKQLTYFSDNEYDEDLPLTYVAGFNYRFNKKILANADIYKPNTNDFSGKLGMEIKIHKNLDLRFGYKTNSDDWKTEGDYGKFAGLSGGMGIFWRNLVIDYAISSFGDLGFVNQISLSYKM